MNRKAEGGMKYVAGIFIILVVMFIVIRIISGGLMDGGNTSKCLAGNYVDCDDDGELFPLDKTPCGDDDLCPPDQYCKCNQDNYIGNEDNG
jgi:hypothetical protein